MIELRATADVRPSAYNPRTADAQRLAILNLSIRKLGFLSPIFATRDGEIISGHQRHLIASELGMPAVPVVSLADLPLEERKSLNIAFNRATNDLARSETSSTLKRRVADFDIADWEWLPDVHDTDRFAPCLSTQTVDLVEIGKAQARDFDQGARNSARVLLNAGCRLPIVMSGGRVINGIGRVQHLLESGETEFEAVQIDERQASLATQMLNWLSMDFDIHTRYADTLRHNSFRRSMSIRTGLGSGFIAPIATGNNWDVCDPENLAKWKSVFGTRVCDFGAGHLFETRLLRSLGIEVDPFEPYRVNGNQIDKQESLSVCGAFLEAVATGGPYNSVFLSSVLNSVPFHRDREHLATLCAALCGPQTLLSAYAISTSHGNWRNFSGGDYVAGRGGLANNFRLEYEPGILVGDFATGKPKVQKFHTRRELYDLFSPVFESVQVNQFRNGYSVLARRPRTDAILLRLRPAIEFEFDLPYPDQSRMGLVPEALAAFSKRLGVEI